MSLRHSINGKRIVLHEESTGCARRVVLISRRNKLQFQEHYIHKQKYYKQTIIVKYRTTPDTTYNSLRQIAS